MSSRVVSFKASEGFVELVDSVARSLGLERSELIRRAVLEYLKRVDVEQRVSSGGDGGVGRDRVVVMADQVSNVVEVVDSDPRRYRFEDWWSATEFLERVVRHYEARGFIRARRVEDYEHNRIIVQLKHISI